VTTVTPETPTGAPGEVVVAVPAASGRRAAAILSCRLHGAIAAATTSTVVVEAGDRAADPDIARVLTCARECAESRGLALVVR